MSNKIKPVIATVVSLVALISAACNTLEGAGKDLESAGDKAEEITKN